MAQDPVGGARPTTRIEAFSDAVFAFAATLLVVSLEVPGSFAELKADLSGFLGFAVSFGALVLIWTVHHAYYRRVPVGDGWTIALNSLLLLVVLFYVYPLKFVAGNLAQIFVPGRERRFVISNEEELGLLFCLYSLGFVGIFLAVALLYRHAHARRERFGLDDVQAYEVRTLFRHYLIFVAVGLLSTLLAWLGVGLRVGLPGFIYMLLGPLCYSHGHWSEKQRPREPD